MSKSPDGRRDAQADVEMPGLVKSGDTATVVRSRGRYEYTLALAWRSYITLGASTSRFNTVNGNNGMGTAGTSTCRFNTVNGSNGMDSGTRTTLAGRESTSTGTPVSGSEKYMELKRRYQFRIVNYAASGKQPTRTPCNRLWTFNYTLIITCITVITDLVITVASFDPPRWKDCPDRNTGILPAGCPERVHAR
jgi:hypothetical protein